MIDYKEQRKSMMVLGNTVMKLGKTRELSAAKTSLDLAMMWTGNYMKFTKLGDDPYKNNGERETVEDIEPMFDFTEDSMDKYYPAKEKHIFSDRVAPARFNKSKNNRKVEIEL